MREHVHRIVWFAILFSMLVYAALLPIVSRGSREPAGTLARDPSAIGVIVVAAVLFVTAFWASSWLRNRDAGRAFFVMLALLDSVSLVGLAGAFRTGDWRLFVVPWCLSMIGMVYAWPRLPARD